MCVCVCVRERERCLTSTEATYGLLGTGGGRYQQRAKRPSATARTINVNEEV